MVIGTILIHIQSRHLLEGLINLLSFVQASKSHLILVSVQIAKSKVVVDDDEVLIELPGLCGVIFGQILKSKMVAVDWIIGLLNVVVELAEDTMNDEIVGVLYIQKGFKKLYGLVFMDIGSLLGSTGAGELECGFDTVLEGGLEPEDELLFVVFLHDLK